MRALLMGVALALSLAGPVRADGGLTDAVAAAYFPRTADAGLHAIAHQRVAEISACATCMNHDGMRAGTAEVIGFNWGQPNGVATILGQWAASPLHNGILSNGSWGRIGCAGGVAGGINYFACVLAAGPLPVVVAAAPAPAAPAAQPILLPDTSMPRRAPGTGSRLLR